MSIINSQPLIGASGNQGGYTIAKSLRFRSSASAYLNRTPASASNRTVWTYSAWVKRGQLGTYQAIFDVYIDINNASVIDFTDTNNLRITNIVSGTAVTNKITSAVYRDPSAWYHIVVSSNSSSALNLYVNGVQVTAWGTNTGPDSSNWFFNSTNAHWIGREQYSTTNYYTDGYLAEVNFIDGQALTPSSFGETDSITGVWKPKAYSGTYGTNGFYLKFTNTTSTATLGNDSSGNGNTWTVNNISLATSSTYDSMKDVPTLTSTTVANYAVLNPLNVYGYSLTYGNLLISLGTATSDTYQVGSTIAVSSGKFYWEYGTGTVTGVGTPIIGVTNPANIGTGNIANIASTWVYYGYNGQKYNGSGGVAYGSTWGSNATLGVALDMDAGTITFYLNNVSQGTAFTNLAGNTVTPCILHDGGLEVYDISINYGQQPFAYTPPTGFLGLNTYNLPTPTIAAGNKYMEATTWTGDNSTANATKNRTGLNFQPDLVWIKSRSNAYSHNIYDAVRGSGASKSLQSDNTNSESTNASNTALYGFLSAFNSDGFQTTNGTDASSGGIWVNQSGQTYVGWQWQAGQGTTSSNTSGSITSTVSVSTTAGFSVVTYTGTGANATVGHGLGVAPKLIILKNRSDVGGYNWRVWHTALSNTELLYLNTTDAKVTGATTTWNSTSPTSTVFSLGTNGGVNASTNTFVAYCWSEIAGFSAFGSYTGNGSTDGPFVYTGFRPKFVLIKSSSGAYYWVIEDSTRNPSNVVNLELFPNDSLAETNASRSVDFLSNGFKIRHTGTTQNSSGDTYIYMAFAENPQKLALAR